MVERRVHEQLRRTYHLLHHRTHHQMKMKRKKFQRIIRVNLKAKVMLKIGEEVEPQAKKRQEKRLKEMEETEEIIAMTEEIMTEEAMMEEEGEMNKTTEMKTQTEIIEIEVRATIEREETLIITEDPGMMIILMTRMMVRIRIEDQLDQMGQTNQSLM